MILLSGSLIIIIIIIIIRHKSKTVLWRLCTTLRDLPACDLMTSFQFLICNLPTSAVNRTNSSDGIRQNVSVGPNLVSVLIPALPGQATAGISTPCLFLIRLHEPSLQGRPANERFSVCNKSCFGSFVYHMSRFVCGRHSTV